LAEAAVLDDVTVVVGSFGDMAWRKLAEERAVPSAERLGVEVIHVHGMSLANARNLGLKRVQTEFTCFLDADDELHPDYFTEMAKGRADLRAPSVQYVRDGIPTRPPYVPLVPGHLCDPHCSADCLEDGNFLVIGSLIRTELALAVGGFDGRWPVYEDWDMFRRCVKRGASLEVLSEAIYVAHVRPDSRNRSMSVEDKNYWHRVIVGA
jgi:glycosyltransferase involved in cell wall biosynthesis